MTAAIVEVAGVVIVVACWLACDAVDWVVVVVVGDLCLF